MAKAQDGDAEAYRLLLDSLASAIEAYVRRMVGDAPFVEDCVQDCLLTVHRARKTYDPERLFRPWLFTLVRHKTIDALRRQTSYSRVIADVEAPVDLAPAAPRDVGAALEASRLLDRLTPLYREAIVLTKLHGYSLAEAAEKAGTTPTAMKSRVHRGLKELAAALASEDE